MTIIDDSHGGGTPISAIKKHLGNIGYVPQSNPNQMQQIQQMHQQQMHQQQMHQQQMHQQQMHQQQMHQQQIHQQQMHQQKMQKSCKKNLKKKNAKKRNIQSLANDVNHSLEKYSPVKKIKEGMSNEIENIERDVENGTLSSAFKEIILLIVLFIIFNQEFVREKIGTFVSPVYFFNSGSLSFGGATILGILFSLIYVTVKKIFI
jgi:cation transport ATPase